MAGRLLLRIEDKKGRVQGRDPCWTASRQFLWEVVHDQHGAQRNEVPPDAIDTIRTLEPDMSAPSKQGRVAAEAAHEAYEAVRSALESQREKGPAFTWVSAEPDGEWAAVHHLEHGGVPYAITGGWTSPALRPLETMEAEHTYAPDEVARVGATRVRFRRQPLADLFKADFETLLPALRAAAEAGHYARFWAE